MMDEKEMRASLKKASRDKLISIIELLLPLIDGVHQLEEEEVAPLKKQNREIHFCHLHETNIQRRENQEVFVRKSGRKSVGQPGHKGTTLRCQKERITAWNTKFSLLALRAGFD